MQNISIVFMKGCNLPHLIYLGERKYKNIYKNGDLFLILIIWITQMTSYEFLHIFS